MQHDERRAKRHGGKQPVAGPRSVAALRRKPRHHHRQRTREQAGRHDGGIDDALYVKWRRPRRINSHVAKRNQQRSEGQRVRGQKEPHPHFLRISSKQRRLISSRQPVFNRIMLKRGVSHSSSSPFATASESATFVNLSVVHG